MFSCSRPVLAAAILIVPRLLLAADVIPHAQDKPPNEPRDAVTAAKMMTVPPGFTVEVVASEPQIVNPVAMTIDERGRFWITESLEYPRKSPGPGRDRVKVLEDTTGDGQVDNVKVFLDGLNIPSGIQVGHGGVWIANAPDILFVPDANRDGVPDGPAEVVVTGFGRTDTHELPNSLTWGPDGWLYGLNGVFNFSHVKYAPENPNFAATGGDQHPGWPITCAMFRIHPRTREFEVFSEGTSNPWGIAFNDEGDAFLSACVIDHLWHLVETGYYHRQGGPYPPHTWKIESIVKHKHQKAAYCGITWFDSDAYPEQYRNKLYMGNIHGGCINVDRIERAGSTYAGSGEPDFLTANDAWFMPVVQKTGPDGCLYVLDWYDRYHCYQDANRDPDGIDRLKGRLYRVRYKETPRKTGFDLAQSTDEQLIELLGNPNAWTRETAQRLLQERTEKATTDALFKLATSQDGSAVQRRHALFALLGRDLITMQDWDLGIASDLIVDTDPVVRAWGARLLTNQGIRTLNQPGSVDSMDGDLGGIALDALADEDPRVRLQGMIYFIRLCQDRQPYLKFQEQLAESIARSGDDPLLQRLAWVAVRELGRRYPDQLTATISHAGVQRAPVGAELAARSINWLLDGGDLQRRQVAELLNSFRESNQTNAASRVLQQLSQRVQSGELKGDALKSLRTELDPVLQGLLAEDADPALRLEASLLALSWGDRAGVAVALSVVESAETPASQRIAAANALVAAGQDEVLRAIAQVFEQSPPAAIDLRGQLLSSLARLDDPEVAALTLHFYPQMEPELQSKAVELLTQRPAWAKALLTRMREKTIPASVLNVNQARRLAESKDESVRDLLAQHWGVVREGRSPDRDRVIAEMRAMIRKTPGDPIAGQAVFKKVCAQCHKMYGEGAEVGPDITLNGRNDYTQLLSNVFDPSLVIGSGYRSYTVATEDGRVINGLLVEESPQRVVLKVQGGKQEIIPRDNIDVFKVSEISLMPEQLERQHTPQEIADLFAYITLDKPPTDPAAKRLPGVYDVVPRSSSNPADFAAIVQEVAPGFTEVRSGEGGVALVSEHFGRLGVVRTHPVSRDQPGVLIREIALPADKKGKLVVDVSHDPRGDWRLVAYVGSGGRMIDEIVSQESCGEDGWATFTASLEKFAGETVKITLRNEANDWAYEFAYWGSVRVEFE